MLPIAKSKEDISMQLGMLNRHGLITGATGTGKTVTLKVMAEQMSKAGIPVFLADIKGDLASLSLVGTRDENIASRLESLNITDYENRKFPVRLWDVFASEGTPIRTTISEMGPMLLSRLLDLNDTQSGIMNIIFKIADDNGLLLLDLKDLQSMLAHVGSNAADYTLSYGNITKQSIGAIQRSLLVLEQQGGSVFFGEPALQLKDFMQTTDQGDGYINILMAKALFKSPLLYSTFLIWLLSQLFEDLPEVGDPEKPKLVFFFDEAHLLFNNAPKAFVDQIEQVVRLIRSKGVGVFFITQNPIDLPENILGQLSNRVQHAIRAYTPKEIKAVKSAADTFRQNPEIDIPTVITQLKVGEALVSFLDEKGQPDIVQQAFIRPPESQMSAIDPLLLPELVSQNIFERIYRDTVDRESAYEILSKKLEASTAVKEEEDKQKELIKTKKEEDKLQKEKDKEEKAEEKAKETARKKNPVNKAANTFFDSLVRTAGREFSRSIMGVFKKK